MVFLFPLACLLVRYLRCQDRFFYVIVPLARQTRNCALVSGALQLLHPHMSDDGLREAFGYGGLRSICGSFFVSECGLCLCYGDSVTDSLMLGYCPLPFVGSTMHALPFSVGWADNLCQSWLT